MESLERGSLTDPAQRFFKRGKRKKEPKQIHKKTKKQKTALKE